MFPLIARNFRHGEQPTLINQKLIQLLIALNTGSMPYPLKYGLSIERSVVLSHELGHVKYQVPNLASYLEYYKEHYSPNVDQYDILGHKPDDPSGKSAIQFERRFRKEYSNFLKMGSEKIEDPMAIMDAIRKNINKNI